MTILTAGALVFGINILTSVIKRWIYPTFGGFGVQVVAFALATIGAFYVLYAGQYPGLTHLIETAGVIFSTSVAFYEVVLQHLSIFKVETPEMTAARLG
jgi:hypothetical protein